MTTPIIQNLEKLLNTPRDNALLRYALGNEWLKAGEIPQAIACFQESVAKDPKYSAAWKLLGKTLNMAERHQEALAAYQQGIEVATAKGDIQAAKEMTVFARRLEKQLSENNTQ